MQIPDLLYEMNHDIGREETEEEPGRLVAIEGSRLPNMRPRQGFDRIMVVVEHDGQKGKVEGSAYKARSNIRYKQTLGLVLNVLPAVSSHGLIEITRLEEEEAHEEVGPLHDFPPPIIMIMSAKGHNVKTNHAYDAKPAQQVKSVVSLFHDPIQYNS